MFNIRGTEQLSSIGISLAEYLLAILMLKGGEIDKTVTYTLILHTVMIVPKISLAHQSIKRIGQAHKMM